MIKIFKNANWKAFFISCIAQFLITSLLYMNVNAPDFLNFLKIPGLKTTQAQIISPEVPKIDILKEIRPKLEPKQSSFQLQKESSLIPTAYAGADYEQAAAYLTVDTSNGQILKSFNSDKKLPMASLTKVMTAVVALDLADPNQEMIVDYSSTLPEPSKLFLKTGERFTMEEMLRGMLISSANDSAAVIANNIDRIYQDTIFIEAMNEKAKLLGMKDTHFTNPMGFDNPQHFSTTEDLAILTQYAIGNYPLISDIVARPFDDLSDGTDERLYLRNWNGLLGVYPGTSGVKIGNTGKAGKTTIVISKRGDKEIMAILLGAPGVLERDLWTAQLLDLSFGKYGLKPVNLTEEELKAKYQTWN